VLGNEAKTRKVQGQSISKGRRNTVKKDLKREGGKGDEEKGSGG
jgi:hypothetical protein